MQAIRIYKIKIRENILRQIIFTDKNIFIGLLIINIILIWLSANNLPTGPKILLSFLSSGISLLIFSLKVDGQSLLKVLYRMINFILRRRKFRG